MAGRATVAHCDVLIAVWDGLRARGRGGTADIVQLALARGTPIVHIPLDPAEPTTILWAAFDPTVVSDRSTAATRRPFVPDQVGRMLAALLAPPDSKIERQFLAKFLGERERGVRPRIEYPLLLMFAGTRRFRREDWDARPGIAATRDEWIDYRAACADCHGVSADLDRLEIRLWLERSARHPFRPILPQRPCVQLPVGRDRRAAGAGRAGRSPTQRSRWPRRSSSWSSRSSSTPRSGSKGAGTSAGSTIASWPSDCARCAA